jgi:hypothetical protein
MIVGPALIPPRTRPCTSGLARACALIGILRHAPCGGLLMPGRDAHRRNVFYCGQCPQRPTLATETAQHAVLTTVASMVRRTGGTLTCQRIEQLLTSVKLDNQCAVASLTWRPLPRLDIRSHRGCWQRVWWSGQT